MKTKIGAIVNVIEAGRLGGPQVRIANVSQKLKDTWPTTVIVPTKESMHFIDKLQDLDVFYISMDMNRLTKQLRGLLKFVVHFIPEVIKLVGIIRKNNFDIVHVSGGAWQFKGVIAACIAHKPVLWHLNDTSMPLAVKILFKYLSPLADGYIFASEKTKKYYKNFIAQNKCSAIIPAPVDTNYYKCTNRGERSERKITIGTVGNIYPNKGALEFAKIANELNNAGLDMPLKFIIIGQKFSNHQKYSDALDCYISESNIENLEIISDCANVKPYLEMMDLYVCTSKYESSPVSVWEAMSMSLPIISSEVGDVPLYVINDKTGYIVPSYTVDAFVTAIMYMIQNRGHLHECGMRAREMAVNHLDVNIIASMHSRIYSAIFSKTTRAL